MKFNVVLDKEQVKEIGNIMADKLLAAIECKKSNEYDISNVDVFGDISIFEEYEDDRIEGSILYRPVFNRDNDIAQTYQENVFKLVKSNKLTDGVYLMSRFDTEYIMFKNKDYFVIKNNKVMAKKEKETV